MACDASSQFTGSAGVDPDSELYAFHETPVAGNINMQPNNGLGSTGVAPGVRVVGLKIRRNNAAGTSCVEVGNALTWIASQDIDITSMSLNFLDCPMQTVQYDGLAAAGVLSFASAGNVNADFDNPQGIQKFWPASLASVAAVAGTDQNGDRWFFSTAPSAEVGSNFGSFIFVSAPAVDFLLSFWEGYTGTGVNPVHYGRYITHHEGGTSYATPQVAAVAGLILSEFPGLTSTQVLDAICQSAKPLADPGMGCGLLKAGPALVDALALVLVFSDGFESGTTSEWSSTVP